MDVRKCNGIYRLLNFKLNDIYFIEEKKIFNYNRKNEKFGKMVIDFMINSIFFLNTNLYRLDHLINQLLHIMNKHV